MILGLCGAHRTGKTTLAKEYVKARSDCVFLETSVSAIFKDLGYNPSGVFDFKTRLNIQEEVLKRVDVQYANILIGKTIVTDRTPLDMLGYTMAEAIGESVHASDQDRFAQYVQKCFDVLNKRFFCVVLVQPGIPLIQAKGKGAVNLAYMEHLNSLILGLSVDSRVRCNHFYIERQYLTIEDRIMALDGACRKVVGNAAYLLNEYKGYGGRVH